MKSIKVEKFQDKIDKNRKKSIIDNFFKKVDFDLQFWWKTKRVISKEKFKNNIDKNRYFSIYFM